MTDLQTLARCLELLRQHDAQMPIQQALCLVQIALQPGLTMNELGKRTGLSQSSCSRNVAALGEWHRFDKPGLGLVVTEDDPRERRRKLIHLTPKGQTLVTALRNTMTSQLS